jgi:hypothetical protein
MMGLDSIISKVIVLIKNAIIGTPPSYTVLKGVYYGDQMGFKEYPVCCVGVPSGLGEKFPVIAGQTVRDEKYTLEIVVYVKLADTEANAKEIITTTDAVRTALRADLQLAGYVYLGEIGDTKFSFGAKGDILFRLSITNISYIKRI